MFSRFARHTVGASRLLFNDSRHTASAFLSAALVGTATAATLFEVNRGTARAESNFDPAQSRVHSWGSSQYYQTGHGHAKNINAPTEIEQLHDARIVKISCGGQQSMCLSDSGQVYTFGRGEDYRLGHGANTNESQPRLVQSLASLKVVAISAGDRHLAAVTDDGALYTWGKGTTMQLGHKPSKVPEVAELDAKIVDVACGSVHTLALSDDGRVFSTGSGYSGALGSKKRINRRKFELIEALKDKKIVQIAAGEDFSLFLSDDGKIYSCGASDFGQSGQGQAERYTCEPKQILDLSEEKIVSISTGSLHAAAVTAQGDVYTWGENKRSQLGHGDNYHRWTPHKVVALEGIKVKEAACGTHHTAVLAEPNNQIFVFGDGRSGQLGRGDQIESQAAFRDKPVELTFFKPLNLTVQSIALGSDHSLAVVTST